MEIKKQLETQKRISEMVKNIHELDKKLSSNQSVAVLDEVEWISPLSILPLVVYANNSGIELKCNSSTDDINSYLKTVCFPGGTEDLSDIGMKFLPITKISCGVESPLLSNYEERILNLVEGKYKTSFANALKYMTSELQSNVEQHSKINKYWLSAQYWNKTRTCEICFADTGIGYRESYRGTKHYTNSHSLAITNAIKGISSKTPEERGAGLPSIMNIFVNGYEGEVIILSGDSLLYLCKKEPIIYESLPINWKGALVGLRFNLKNIDIAAYYE